MTATSSIASQSRSVGADLSPPDGDLDGRAAATVALLAADAVEAADSGHPGLPMGMATPAWVLWSRFLRVDPSRPDWPDRDRFVLSAGHGSMLLYGLLHLFGYDLPREQLRRFRQWGSATPGHPEHGLTPGVETTTGPLGQGLANAAGMALAERHLAARFNPAQGPPIVDHRTFVLASDGDLMEGISHEAASLAGHLGLGRLVVLYDDNRVTIDGSTDLAYSEDAEARFAAYGWDTAAVDDSEDTEALGAAIEAALDDEDRPSLIRVRTRIGRGAPEVEGTAAAHGKPLGTEQLAATRERFGWPDERFFVPDDVAARCRELAEAGAERRRSWERRVEAWTAEHPELAREWRRTQAGELPDGLEHGADLGVRAAAAGKTEQATRDASGTALASAAGAMPELIGGSADLAGSTRTNRVETTAVTAGDHAGSTVHFGVREHAMAAMCNGLALHGGLRPYAATFTVFSDYARPAIRLAALMELPVVYLFTHDSVGVGEDGPTHQPVEHLAALRAIPNLAVLRPADAHETAACWRTALERTDGPTALMLTRQAVQVLRSPPEGAVADTGAWITRDTRGRPDVALVATGSEVSVALKAAVHLDVGGIAARVVSMPWRERFLSLSDHRRRELLPRSVPRVVVEAGVSQGWGAVAGLDGTVVGLDRFGASAPGQTVMSELGITPERVAAAAEGLVSGQRSHV